MKLCPICDRELNSANYCSLCKRVIKKPWLISDGIYLNKSHSGVERNCEFHKRDRKTTYLNRRHDADEAACSYHQPEMTAADAKTKQPQKKLFPSHWESKAMPYLNRPTSGRLWGR